MRTKTRLLPTSLTVLALVATGCGNDEGVASPEPGTGEAAYCEATFQAATIMPFGPEVDFENASEEEIEAAVEAYGAAFEPHHAVMKAQAPEEVAEATEELIELFGQSIETGTPPEELDGWDEAHGAVDDYLAGNCGLETWDVSAVDYGYEGLPTEAEAGEVAFTLTNDGEEFHEAVIFKRKEGVTQSIEELFELPEEEAMALVEPAGGVHVGVGEDGRAFLDLTPGTYTFVCFVSVGSVGETEGEGPPHFTEGMVREVTVT